jgi:hypothetical protein
MPLGGREPARACVPFFLPLHELGFSEELSDIEFPGVGSQILASPAAFLVGVPGRFDIAIQRPAATPGRFGHQPDTSARLHVSRILQSSSQRSLEFRETPPAV